MILPGVFDGGSVGRQQCAVRIINLVISIGDDEEVTRHGDRIIADQAAHLLKARAAIGGGQLKRGSPHCGNISNGRPAKWRFNRRCRGGEHTAQEAWHCNRSLGND